MSISVELKFCRFFGRLERATSDDALGGLRYEQGRMTVSSGDECVQK